MTWREITAKAKKRGRFTSRERDLLASFETCIVGEQHLLHPEVVVYDVAGSVDGRRGPVDAVLWKLGGEAFNRTCPCHPERLEPYLDEIEDRVLQLKREADV